MVFMEKTAILAGIGKLSTLRCRDGRSAGKIVSVFARFLSIRLLLYSDTDFSFRLNEIYAACPFGKERQGNSKEEDPTVRILQVHIFFAVFEGLF